MANFETTGSVTATSTVLKGATSGAVTIQAPASPTSYTLTFPPAQGGAGQTLLNDGAGNLSWG